MPTSSSSVAQLELLDGSVVPALVSSSTGRLGPGGRKKKRKNNKNKKNNVRDEKKDAGSEDEDKGDDSS